MTNFDGLNSNNDRLNAYQPPRRTSKFKRFVIFLFVLTILAGVGFAGFKYIGRANQIFTGKKNIFKRVGGLFISNDKPLKGEESGVINILLLGIGGEGHDGAYLTDTMIVASIKLDTDEVVLTSIPRDWQTTIPNHGINKINAVYAYGLQDHPNDIDAAGKAAITAAEQITGFSIPYYAQVDFKGFVQAVDHVGGVDITVDRTFSDSTFPNDFPYDTKGLLGTVTFNKGPQHMDGRTALIFARSRHGTNDEGSDFARSERQKKIIVAVRDKLNGLGITNINTLNNLLTDFTNNFRTNLEPYELLRLSKIAKDISADNVYSLSLEPDDKLICATTIDQLTGKQYIHPVEEIPSTTAPSSTPPSTKTDTTTKTTPKPTPIPTPTSTKPSPTPTPTSKTPTPTPTPTPIPTPSPSLPTQIPMYVVIPCYGYGKTIDDIHNFLADYWDTARLKKESATIEIQNSTGKAAATTPWKNLADLKISFNTYPGKTPFERTIIYDNTKGAKNKTLQYLKDHFQLTQADVQYTNSKADFVIVLGNDSL
jgi:LCP family protein required for cell wall assembly